MQADTFKGTTVTRTPGELTPEDADYQRGDLFTRVRRNWELVPLSDKRVSVRHEEKEIFILPWEFTEAGLRTLRQFLEKVEEELSGVSSKAGLR